MVQARACKALYSGSIPLAASNVRAAQGLFFRCSWDVLALYATRMAQPSRTFAPQRRALRASRATKCTPANEYFLNKPGPPGVYTQLDGANASRPEALGWDGEPPAASAPKPHWGHGTSIEPALGWGRVIRYALASILVLPATGGRKVLEPRQLSPGPRRLRQSHLLASPSAARRRLAWPCSTYRFTRAATPILE